jgi:hypothetical protein
MEGLNNFFFSMSIIQLHTHNEAVYTICFVVGNVIEQNSVEPNSQPSELIHLGTGEN